MTLSINNESKNSLTITNEAKVSDDQAWADRDITWAESGPAGDTWGVPGTVVTRESKNSLSITNESKN